MTLKTVLKNFLNYADTLEAQKKLGKDLYEVDFQKLKALTEELKREEDYATSEGLKDVNRRKNRYKDILPYDYTRVILSEYPGVPGSDFINANYIKGASGSLAYIASQGPLPNTVVDFWRMIWECEIQVIVMACNEQESGKYKCECYWPTDEEKKQYGNINVEFVKWRQVCPDFLVRTLKACWESEERVICQFHYTTWPDHGVPNSVQPILELVRLIRDCQASEAVPVLVHCSAGCGRTGTICAIDYVWGLMRMGKLTKNFNLYNVIADMRRQRIAMVQTKEQYVLVHKAVSSLFEQQLRVIDSHTYENLDEDGEPLILKEMQQEEDIYEDILDPPLEDNYLSEEKHAEKKMQSVKSFSECVYGNKEPPLVPLKKETYLDYLCHLKKANDTGSNEMKNTSDGFYVIQQDDKTELNSKDLDYDENLHYTKNSRTLQKLCREESVKRLISGWNKSIEHSDEVKTAGKETQTDAPHCKSPFSKKHPDSLLSDQKTSQSTLNASHDQMRSQKVENISHAFDNNKINKGLKDKPLLSEASPKTSSPEDTHAGKLVGKATVIRRPSIAKLKALFEKSTQESSESNRQRRALFRSHSHYVSQSSRAFTVSDAGEQHSNSNQSNESYHQENSAAKDNADQRVYSERHRNNNSVHAAERSSENVGTDYSSEVSRAAEKSPFDSNKSHAFNNTPHESLSSTSESFGSFEGVEYKVQVKKPAHKNEKPPELPIKKKLPAPPLQAETVERPLSEATLPRFHVSVNKGNSIYSEVVHRNSVHSQRETDANKVGDQTDSHHKRMFQNCNFEDSTREYRRHSQEIERKVLHKNQSFSDPEQGSSRTVEINQQIVKPKSSLTEQTYPKQSFSNSKNSSVDKSNLTYESTYMNVNSLAQKNIRQIEDKLKNHPRGAIIDLTSRKSYIDEMAVPAEKQYVFRNTSHPVKFLQPQESRDLTPQEKCNINKSENSSSKSNANAEPTPKNSESKSNTSKNDADINSKNLLLHSPPPKSKRGHLSKASSKSPISPPTSSAASDTSNNTAVTSSQQTQSKQTISKTMQPANFSLVNSPPNLNIAISNNTNVVSNNTNVVSNNTNVVSNNTNTTAADRSDPRYFPVTRQTASDAKYESERHKALSRERSGNIYETLYSVKSSVPIYQKLPVPYDKSRTENYEKINPTTYSKDPNPKSSSDKEPLYGLQRSTSGPQMLPDNVQKGTPNPDTNKPSHETCQPPNYDQSASFRLSSCQQNSFPLGPPKPPRTFHYDQKGNQERTPSSEAYKPEQTLNRDGGRYIVTVASPKHSNPYSNVPPPRSGTNVEYRYTDGVLPDPSHHNAVNPSHHQYPYVPQSTNEVHMSRSYPFTNYDNLYSHPRPYGKQFYPESVVYRNVQPVTHVNNSIYSTIKEKPRHTQQDIYGTVKNRNTFSDYENVYDAQVDYMRAMSSAHLKNEHQALCQSSATNSMHGIQYSQSDANVYGVMQAPKAHNHLSKGNQMHGKMEYQNLDDVPSSKRVYFDTLQRKHKQHVSWEQRRSHDDMDIRPAPSARLREQIHARRSMVELDNLEISVISDEGYPEKHISEGSMSSPEPLTKMTAGKNEHYSDAAHTKSLVFESLRESQQRKVVSHNKEPTSFGETLSKAFGRLTSLTKFAKDTQTSGPAVNDNSNNIPKDPKKKEKEKQPNFAVRSPPATAKESPSEQWTQV